MVAGQNTSALRHRRSISTAQPLHDGAGNAANLSLSGLTQSGPQIDTTAPTAPVITNDTVNANDTVTLTGTAEANSTIHVLNGSDVLGTTTANASGSWSFTTGELTAGSYTFTATATDAAGNTSAVSSGIDPTIGLPAAPAIVSFSPDSGPAGADVTNAKILTLTGTAPAASTVEVFDGSTELGTTTANAAGAWSYTTGSTGGRGSQLYRHRHGCRQCQRGLGGFDSDGGYYRARRPADCERHHQCQRQRYPKRNCRGQ